MARDISQAVRSCAHCRVSNLTSHEAQQKLKSVMAAAPFEIMAFDIWKPGDIPSFIQAGKSKTSSMLLTGIDTLTSFAGAASLENASSVEVTRVLFEHFVGVFGLPKLIIIDSGSEFAGTLIATCQTVHMKYHTVQKATTRPHKSNDFIDILTRSKRCTPPIAKPLTTGS